MSESNLKTSVTLEIDRLSYGPYGIGRVSGKAVMIPYTAPGDQVSVRVRESKPRYDIGEITRLIAPSPLRQSPPCRYFTSCGGCSWQHLKYDAQLKAKQENVADALRRIGKLTEFELKAIVPASHEYHYRRRIRLQVEGNHVLGFFGSGSHRVVEISSCLIAEDRLNNALELLHNWIHRIDSAVENIQIVAGDQPAEVVAIFRAVTPLTSADESVCADLVSETHTIRGLICFSENGRRAWGQTAITLALSADLSLTVDADVFTQVNSAGNREMLQALLGAANFNATDRVLELYCGAGNFTIPIARTVQEVIAVEGDRAAIRSGKLNAQKNELANIRWTCAAVPKVLEGLKRAQEKFAKIVLDPPRSGAKEIMASLADLGATRIFYISCNPTTLARDLAELTKRGYRLRMVQPFDFFPQTFHVETLAVLER